MLTICGGASAECVDEWICVDAVDQGGNILVDLFLKQTVLTAVQGFTAPAKPMALQKRDLVSELLFAEFVIPDGGIARLDRGVTFPDCRIALPQRHFLRAELRL